MKIALLSPLPPPNGGIASWTVNCLNFAEKFEEDIQIIHINTVLRGLPITNTSFFKRVIYGIKGAVQIIRNLKEQIDIAKPDVIHLASSASLALIKDYLILRVSHKQGIPLICHWRFGRIPDISEHNTLEWKLFRYITRSCAVSIVLDRLSYDELFRRGVSNVIKIPNPTGPEVEIKSRDIQANPTHRIPGRVLFVGHLIRAKGIYELVTACTKADSVQELMLVGLYEEGVRDDLIEIAHDRQDASWLKFSGELSRQEVLEQMSISPILALPSYTEGFPNVIIEGMAMGCAIVASNVGAIPEMILDAGEKPCGIAINPKDIEGLCLSIEGLQRDSGKIKEMGQRGIIRSLDQYAMSGVFSSYRRVWNEVAGKGAAS